jgi:hypothetical protein
MLDRHKKSLRTFSSKSKRNLPFVSAPCKVKTRQERVFSRKRDMSVPIFPAQHISDLLDACIDSGQVQEANLISKEGKCFPVNAAAMAASSTYFAKLLASGDIECSFLGLWVPFCR